MTRDTTTNLDQVFSSSGRMRILTLLSEVEELHLTEISKRTDQSYSATVRHLEALQKAGLVEEKDYGRVRIFKLRLDNPRTRLLQELIFQWKEGPEKT